MRLRLVFLSDFLCSSSVFWGSSGGRLGRGAGGGPEGLVSGGELLVLGGP